MPGTLGIISPPTRGSRSTSGNTPQYSVAQVRIDKDKESARLAAAENMAREWNFVRGVDKEDEEPKPNLTGMLNFIFEQVESVDHVRKIVEMRVQQDSITQMGAMITEMAESDVEEEQEWALGEGAEWMKRATAHLNDLKVGIIQDLEVHYGSSNGTGKAKN